MKAAVLYEPQKPLVIEDLKLLAPPKAAQVRVRRCCERRSCHSDLHAVITSVGMKMASPPPGAGRPPYLGGRDRGRSWRGRDFGERGRPRGATFRRMRPLPLLHARAGESLLRRDRRDSARCSTAPRVEQEDTEIFHFAYTSTFAEEAVVPESCAIKIRDDVPLDRACFVGRATMTGIGAAHQHGRERRGRGERRGNRMRWRGPQRNSGGGMSGRMTYRDRSSAEQTRTGKGLRRDACSQSLERPCLTRR